MLHCVFYNRKPIDMDLVHKAAGILSGRHDYRSFTRPKQLIINPQPTVRTVNIRIEPGAGFLVDYTPPTLFSNRFEYWNFVFEAHSFLNKQVHVIIVTCYIVFLRIFL